MQSLKTKKYFVTATVFLISIVFWKCGDQNTLSGYVAKINDLEISGSEFQKRLAFNPLSASQNPELYKRNILASLITEKILASEAKHNPEIEASVKEISNQYLKEAMIEQIRMDSVESKISIPESQIHKRYINSLKEIRLKYAAFQSFQEAERVCEEINTGMEFETAIREYMDKHGWKQLPIPEKEIIYGSEPKELEESIFNMEEHQISEPIRALGEYYLVKIEQTNYASMPSQKEFNKQKKVIENELYKEQSKRLYKEFYQRQIYPRLATVEKNQLTFISEQLADRLFNKVQKSPPELSQLPSDVESYLTSNLKHTDFIKFQNGSIWQGKEVLWHLKNGPFAFDFTSADRFLKSFENNVHLLIEFEAIYQFALEKGYNKNDAVRNEFEMWQSGLLSKALRSELAEGVAETSNIRKNSARSKLDAYLVDISTNYHISVNTKIYDQIAIPNVNVLVRKSHFANRAAAPAVESISSLTEWQSKIKNILINNGIKS